MSYEESGNLLSSIEITEVTGRMNKRGKEFTFIFTGSL